MSQLDENKQDRKTEANHKDQCRDEIETIKIILKSKCPDLDKTNCAEIK